MGKEKKKYESGGATAFIPRNKAIKKLQLTLADFRRLCILKGIFPKDPKRKFKGPNKTYYALKDIKFLSHERLLAKFREISAYERKIIKAKAKQEKYDLKKLIENKPNYTITHILRERYPRFTDSLNDLDDALCLINLFSTLPKHDLLKVKTETIQLCQRLIREFYLYCAIAQNFKKGFISIKGIYLSVEIMNTEITWLCPVNQPQRLSFEIDYDIMLNFLELYTSLMKQINLKLFKDIGLEYPPPADNVDTPFFGYSSLDIHSIQESLMKRKEKSNLDEELNLDSEEMKKIKEREEENRVLKNLFKNCVFYISREVPNELFGLAILSCGGLYGDENDNTAFNADDDRITHYIVDRPSEFITAKPNKEYIQPQWVFDCINSKKLLPISEYTPGKKLPPHLSPYYELVNGEYKPNREININVADLEGGEKVDTTAAATNEEDIELREMLLSKNKKKLLQKVRQEKAKKIRTVHK